MILFMLQQLTRIGHPIFGYIIPAAIFLFSFFVAYRLYKRFSKQMEED